MKNWTDDKIVKLVLMTKPDWTIPESYFCLPGNSPFLHRLKWGYYKKIYPLHNGLYCYLRHNLFKSAFQNP